MSPCRDCGRLLADGDRFCSTCGAAAQGGPVLLGAAPGVIPRTYVAEHGADRNRLMVAIGAVLLAVLAWSFIGSWGGGGGAYPRDPDEPIGPSTVPSTAPPTRATTEPSVQLWRPRTTVISRVGAEAGQPLLGRPVGLSLFLGGGSSNLRRLDLDTGELTEYQIRGQPVHATDDWLVLIDPSGQPIEAVPLDEPHADSHLLADSLLAVETSSDSGPGTIWLLTADDPVSNSSVFSSTWRLTRVADGRTLEEIPAASSSFAFTAAGPMVTSSPSGGVFVSGSDGYRRVFDGTPVKVSDDFVLARACRLPTECSLHWLRRGSWQEVGRPIPSEEVERVNWLSPDGRVLAYQHEGQLRFFDAERGEVLDLGDLGAVDPASQVAASPDGRYLVLARSRIELHDLDATMTYRIELNAIGDDHLLLVASG